MSCEITPVPVTDRNYYNITLNPTSNPSSPFVNSYYPYTPITTDANGKILDANITTLCVYRPDSNNIGYYLQNLYDCEVANGTSYHSLYQILSAFTLDPNGNYNWNNDILLIPSHTWSNGVYSWNESKRIKLIQKGSDYYLYYWYQK